MTKNDITIGIVSYHRGDRLRRCVETLAGYNIIVWDNNTTGPELEKIKKVDQDYDNVKIIYSKENFGCPKAFNELILRSPSDWVILTVDDMLFDSNWFEVLNDIINSNPTLEQIHLNSFNCMAFHKKTIARMGWWDEGYRYYPSCEDDDWYLRTVELLGYSPYTNFPKHIQYPQEYIDNVKPSNLEELFNRSDNFTYYCNSPHSTYPIIGESTVTGGDDDAGSRNNSEGSMDRGSAETGIQYHNRKWSFINSLDPLSAPGALLSKDSRCWTRDMPDIDFYPEERREYIKKYFGNQVYQQFIEQV